MDFAKPQLYSSAAIRERESRAVATGTPSWTLMQRAAAAGWDEVLRRWPLASRVHIVCGPGNNGGDGYAIATLARRAGCDVTVWTVGGAPMRGDAVQAHREWVSAGGVVRSDAIQCADADVIVDALLGIGLTRDVSGLQRDAVIAINRAHGAGTPVLSVDVPSGLNADTGAVMGVAVMADVTVTMIGYKPGLFTGPGCDHAGAVVMADLQLAADSGDGSNVRLLQADALAQTLPRRRANVHKGHHGHVLVVGGNHGMVGAALLSARAALRSGAGLVSVATRETHASVITGAQPELMAHGVEDGRALRALIERVDVIAIGPGMGQDVWARAVFAAVLQSSKPLVIDADALNLLAEEPTVLPHAVLTPHPGEAARLLRVSTVEVQRDRLAAAQHLHARYGAVSVLKGAGTLVQGSETVLCPYGNPGMAVGGMGDVLTGVIAALLAQGLSLEPAAHIGVLAHALAGDRVAAAIGPRGLLPSDVIDALPSGLNP